MSIVTAQRMRNVRRSFVREILKAAASRDVISFAGGLPNPKMIPVAQIGRAIQEVLAEQGPSALQYCAAEGHPALRQWVAEQYNVAGLSVVPEQILITTGSQQALDLLGKVLIEPGDRVIVEDPTYVAAIQSLGIFEPEWCPVLMDSEGIDADGLRTALRGGAKMVYAMPNFQNPTGISYSAARREAVVELLQHSEAILIEDDPYNRLRYRGQAIPPMARDLPTRAILLGTFSKIFAPGLRLGWLCAPLELMEKLTIAKQAADLCSENLGQWAIQRLLASGEFERHLKTIREVYASQCDAMLDAVARHLPDVQTTRPDGGMFLWITLPDNMSAIELFQRAIARGVAFVPGQAFFARGGGEDTLRLNFTHGDASRIDEGMRRLALAVEDLRSAQVPR